MTEEIRQRLLTDCFSSFLIEYSPVADGPCVVEDIISTSFVVEAFANVFHFEEEEIVEMMVKYDFKTIPTKDGIYWRVFTITEENLV